MTAKFIGEVEMKRNAEDRVYFEDGRWVITANVKRVYEVWTDNCSDTEDDVLSVVGIPPLFSTILGIPCVGRSVKELGEFIHNGQQKWRWHVTCGFDSNIDVNQSDQPPDARTPEVRWTTETVEEMLHFSVDDPPQLITTSAYEAVPIAVQIAQPVLEIKRFEVWPFDPDIILQYVSTLNSGPFYGAPEGCAQMMSIDSVKSKIEDQFYSNTTYKIRFKMRHDGSFNFVPNTFQGLLRDHGTQYLKTKDDGVTKEIVKNIVEGEIVKVGLDGAGSPVDAQTTQPAIIPWNIYPKTNFNNLNLGPY